MERRIMVKYGSLWVFSLRRVSKGMDFRLIPHSNGVKVVGVAELSSKVLHISFIAFIVSFFLAIPNPLLSTLLLLLNVGYLAFCYFEKKVLVEEVLAYIPPLRLLNPRF